jgi:acyl carrier protein
VREWDDLFEGLLRGVLPPEHHALITPTVSLEDLGLDSMASVQLLMAVENTYHILLPPEYLDSDTFATPRALWSVVSTLVTPA